MKKIILFTIVLLISTQLFAQKKGKIRGGIDLGISSLHKGGGITGDLDLRYNIKDNINAGLMFGFSMLAKDIQLDSSNEDQNTAGMYLFTLANGDYYFSIKDYKIAPFAGGGFGVFSISNIRLFKRNEKINKLKMDNKLGGLIRGGIEYGKFRLAVSYFIVPSSNLYNSDGKALEKIKNNFLNVSIGFYLGGGKRN